MLRWRRRFEQNSCLQDRLTAWAAEVREEASRLAPGAEKDALLRKASRADTAAHIDDWINSPGLQSPR
jgi:hypothetical protein